MAVTSVAEISDRLTFLRIRLRWLRWVKFDLEMDMLWAAWRMKIVRGLLKTEQIHWWNCAWILTPSPHILIWGKHRIGGQNCGCALEIWKRQIRSTERCFCCLPLACVWTWFKASKISQFMELRTEFEDFGKVRHKWKLRKQSLNSITNMLLEFDTGTAYQIHFVSILIQSGQNIFRYGYVFVWNGEGNNWRQGETGERKKLEVFELCSINSAVKMFLDFGSVVLDDELHDFVSTDSQGPKNSKTPPYL